MLTATTHSTTDTNAAQSFIDSNGTEWFVEVDAADGTLAVQNHLYPPQAGIFTWNANGEEGTITIRQEGDFYGVNCDEEFVVDDGEWVQNDD